MSARDALRPRNGSGGVRTSVGLCVFSLVLLLGGCKSWEPARVAPAQLFAGEAPSRVRVTLLEGEPLELRDPTLVNDTIVGTIEVPGDPRHGSTTRVPLEYVRQLEVRSGTDPVATGAGVAVGAIVVGFLGLLLILSLADLG